MPAAWLVMSPPRSGASQPPPPMNVPSGPSTDLIVKNTGPIVVNVSFQQGAEFWFDVWRSGEGEHNRLAEDAKIAGRISGYPVPTEPFTGDGILVR